MKKVLSLTGMLFLLTTLKAETSQDLYRFTSQVEQRIYKGTRNGKLTQREVNRLQSYIDEYQYTLWKFEYRGRLSKKEKRQVLKMQDQIVESLTYALNNREVVRSWRNIGNRNGRNGRGGSDWQGNRNDNNRSGGMCPPPSRDNKPRRRSTF